MIKNYCKICAVLTSQDIDKIQRLEETAKILSNVLGLDVFIDCPTKDNEKALVVHHSRPEIGSIYSKNIAGEVAFYKDEPAVLRTLRTGLPSKNYKAVNQEGEIVFQSVIAIKNETNEIIGTLILEYSYANKSHACFSDTENPEDIINNFLETGYAIPELVKDGIVVFNNKEIVTYANGVAKSIYEKIGFQSSIIGENFKNIVITDIKFNNILENKKIDVIDINIAGMVLSVTYFATLENRKNQNVIMIIRDITQEKIKEREIILKSVAIKEIHHRVKNNLQTVASLLRIQSRRTENEEVKKILDETISRILSIAITHEILSEKGFDILNVREIVDLIYKNYSTKTIDKKEKIEFNIIGSNFNISSEKATGIALVINEIIQNIVNYAFPDESDGKVDILIEKDHFFSRIIISDNGVGMSREKMESSGLGLIIVEKIVKEQLNGNLKITSEIGKGTKVRLEIKNEY